MADEIKELQWEQYGKLWIGLDGTQIVCSISQPPDSPLEMYAIMFYDAYPSYTTPEAAKQAAEKAHAQFGKRAPLPDLGDMIRPVLTSLLKSLEKPQEGGSNG
jgi:hypothetical protein